MDVGFRVGVGTVTAGAISLARRPRTSQGSDNFDEFVILRMGQHKYDGTILSNSCRTGGSSLGTAETGEERIEQRVGVGRWESWAGGRYE